MIPFDQLCDLFKGGYESRGLCRFNLEEAVYLYQAVASIKNPCAVEIGRYFGGLTRILLGAGARVLSIDNHSKDGKEALQYDRELTEWAQQRGLKNSLELVVGDSRYFKKENLTIDVLVIDGGHSYETVKADCENWIPELDYGVDMFFHDINLPGVNKVAYEYKHVLFPVKKITSLLHLRKGE